MSTSKSYTVNYNITANATKAAEELKSLQTAAEKLVGQKGPITQLSAAITNVSSSLQRLEAYKNITFTPDINTTKFNQKIGEMTTLVKNKATEMHRALYGALTGTTPKEVLKDAGKEIQKEIRSVKTLNKLIEAEKKNMYETLRGGKYNPKTGKWEGFTLTAEAARNSERIGKEYRQSEQILKKYGEELKKAEEIEKQAGVTHKKATAATPVKAPSVTSNVTAADVKTLQKFFGDRKGRTVTATIKANAGGKGGALDIIKQVQAGLDKLKAGVEFTITPILAEKAFAQAQTQLETLRDISREIATPFGPLNDKRKGKGKGKNAKTNKKGAAEAYTADVVGNITKLTNSVKEFTVPVVGELTKVTNKLTEAIPVNVKVMADQVTEALKGIPTPTLTVKAKIDSTGISQQLQNATTPQKLTKTEEKRLAALNNKKSLSKGEKAEQAQLLTKQAASKPITAQQNVTAKLVLNTIGIAEQIEKIKLPVLSIKAKIDTTGIKEQFNKIASPTIKAYLKLGWKDGAVGKQKQLAALSEKMPALKLTLDTTLANEKLEAFIAKINGLPAQAVKLTATGAGTTNAGAAGGTSNMATGGTTQSKSAGTGTTSNQDKQKSPMPLTAQARYDKAKADAAKRTLNTKQNVTKWQEVQTQARNWHAQQQAMYDKLFGAQKPVWTENPIRRESERIAKTNERYTRMAAQSRMRGEDRWATMRDAQSAFSKGLTPYEKQLQAQEEAKLKAQQKATAALNTANHLRRAEALRGKGLNAMLSFAQTKEQLNTMFRYRHFFNDAMRTTGITPTVGMEDTQMLRYLNGVANGMSRKNVAIPWQLQSQINKLQAQIERASAPAATSTGRGYGGGMYQNVRQPRAVPFYDRSRKWSYPFTGNTSFGASTPMAVDMAKGMGVMFAIGGAMSAVGESFSEAVEYQNTMRTTNAILEHGTDTYTPQGFKNMEKTVRDVGVETKFTAPQVADAARFLAMAGYDINAINNAIRPIADLAIIGDNDLGEVADKMTNIMTTFHIAPEDMRGAANIMTTTMTRSNTDLMMLAESAKYGGGVAHMYGRNDKNLFADTMALFGVMGNSGIQASSAGTALRMMYQNIFKPNKTQKAMLGVLQSKYGIKTTNADGSYRSMADFLIDIAGKVPQNQLPALVGNLFRITAQPGANAAITAAEIQKAAEQDGTDASEVAKGINAVSTFMGKNEGGGLSTLVKLMQANRASVSGNVSGEVADAKKNTIQGLWYQMTSTFTEGIVKAFEQREGQFSKMLADLRDYLAKPETVQMINNLMDMLIELGKVMAWFVKIWANLYNLAPGVIKTWIVAQMAFTQIGALISPFIQMMGAFSRFGDILAKFTGISVAATTAETARLATTRATTTASATGAAGTILNGVYALPFDRRTTIGASRFKGHTKGYLAKANKWENAIMTAMAFNGITGDKAKNVAERKRVASTGRTYFDRHTNKWATTGDARVATAMANKQRYLDRYAEVQARAQRIYGAKGRMARAFNSGATMGMTALSFGSVFSNLKGALMSLLLGLSKIFGLLVNPITLTVAGFAAVGFAAYKLKERMDGATDAQKIEQARSKKISEAANQARTAQASWYNNMLQQNMPVTVGEVAKTEKSKEVIQYEQERENFKKLYADIFERSDKDNSNASKQSVQQTIDDWRKSINRNPSNKLAFGVQYGDLVGSRLTDWERDAFDTYAAKDVKNQDYSGLPAVLKELWNSVWYKDTVHATELQDKQVQGALMIQGANSSVAQKAVQQLIELRERVSAGKLTKDDYLTQAREIQSKTVNLGDPHLLESVGMTPQQLLDDPDISRYYKYQEGIYNILEATIRGDVGTYTGYLDAVERLRGNVQTFTSEWWDAISHVLGNYQLIYDAVSDDGKTTRLQLAVSALPDGRIDYSNLVQQIREKVNNFHLGLQSFMDMVKTIYQLLANSGLVPKTYEGAVGVAKENIEHKPIDKEMAHDYYINRVRGNKAWKGVTERQYTNWILNQDGKTTDDDYLVVNGHRLYNANERQAVRGYYARQVAQQLGYKPTPKRNKTVQNGVKQQQQVKAAQPVDYLTAPKPEKSKTVTNGIKQQQQAKAAQPTNYVAAPEPEKPMTFGNNWDNETVENTVKTKDKANKVTGKNNKTVKAATDQKKSKVVAGVDKTKQQADQKDSTNDNKTNLSNPGNGTANDFQSAADQSGYKSHYDRSAARPTQINIHIDRLANFDRTMVASNAEERDLLASMEGKITDTVYRLFTEAMRSARTLADQNIV